MKFGWYMTGIIYPSSSRIGSAPSFWLWLKRRPCFLQWKPTDLKDENVLDSKNIRDQSYGLAGLLTIDLFLLLLNFQTRLFFLYKYRLPVANNRHADHPFFSLWLLFYWILIQQPIVIARIDPWAGSSAYVGEKKDLFSLEGGCYWNVWLGWRRQRQLKGLKRHLGID